MSASPFQSCIPQLFPHFREVRSIAIFRALQLGDVLCIVPALRALRKAFPHARLSLITLPWGRGFVSRFHHLVDEFIEFPGHPELPEKRASPGQVREFVQQMQGRGFDLVLQMHGSGSVVNELLHGMDGRCLAGFYEAPEDIPGEGWYLPWPHQGHEIQRFLSLVTSIGVPPQGDQLEFPVRKEDRRELQSLPEWAALQQPYVCIHPGARMRTRRWLAPRFAEVADFLVNHGYRVVLTGSPDEAELVHEVAEAMVRPAVNLAGKTSLGALGALLENAALLVCNDTGISHVACGVGTRSVVITMGSDPARWAPLDRSRHRLVIHEPVTCRPCYHDVCPIGHNCAQSVTSHSVIGAIRQLLSLSES